MAPNPQTDIPYTFCPSYFKCSVNQCPLDPGWAKHQNLEGDETKCVSQKPTRIRIFEKLSDAGNPHIPRLRFEWRTAKEERGRKRAEAFNALPEEERQALLERLEKARAARGKKAKNA